MGKRKKEDPTPLKVELVRGQFGHMALYVNDYRVAGTKPWGGGPVVWSGYIDREDLEVALKQKPR